LENWCKAVFSSFLLAASLAQGISFLPWVLIVLVIPSGIIGTAAGAFAVTKGIRTEIAGAVAVMSMLCGIPFGFVAITIAARLSPSTGRPFVQHIEWYALTLAIIGTATSLLVIGTIAWIRDQRTT
jgi:hypothetical protein